VLRLTIFGVIVTVVLSVTLALRLPVADPSVAGLVWAGLAAAAVLGAVWPLVAVRTVKLTIVHAPTDLVVGQVASLEIELSGRASGLTLRCSGSPLLVADVTSPSVTRIPLEIAARGAYDRIQIDLGSDAPFGVALAVRTRTLDLPRRLLVGPATVAEPVRVAELAGEESDSMPRGIAMSGESVRSVRPYVSGDPSHLVHWPTSARAGELVVRELEPPVATGIALRVDLTPPRRRAAVPAPAATGGGTHDHRGERHWSAPASGVPGDAPAIAASPEPEGLDLGSFLAVELAASRAAGAAEDALAQGARVVLCTVEVAGPVVDEVSDLLAVRRRLALAVDGVPPSAPGGWPTVTIDAGVAPAPPATIPPATTPPATTPPGAVS